MCTPDKACFQNIFPKCEPLLYSLSKLHLQITVFCIVSPATKKHLKKEETLENRNRSKQNFPFNTHGHSIFQCKKIENSYNAATKAPTRFCLMYTGQRLKTCMAEFKAILN